MLLLGWLLLAGLFAGAGGLFVAAQLAMQRLRREGADVPGLQTGRMSQEWRRFRHPHLPPNRKDQGRMQKVTRLFHAGAVLLLMALGLLSFLMRAS